MINSNGTLTRDVKPLTPRALEFCRVYVSNGGNGQAAYAQVYAQENLESAKVSACQLLKDKRILQQIEWEEDTFRVVGYKMGMTKESIVSMLMQMMNATKKDSKGNESPDWPARNNAIVVFSRLTGDLDKRAEAKKEENPQEEKSLFKDLSKLSGQQLIEARKDILDKMVLQ